jgi:cytochrome c oxidase subunit 5b
MWRGTAARILLRACAPSMQQTPQLLQSPPARPIAPVVRWIQTKAALRAHGGGQLDEFGIATGAEREELEAKREGKKRFDLDPPRGAFGTHDAPAIVESHYDVRIVGCSGGVGEDEHDVTWFHLEKGKPYECPVCSQVFQLKVTGVGGQPGHDEHH